jgi:hypothetical protein
VALLTYLRQEFFGTRLFHTFSGPPYILTEFFGTRLFSSAATPEGGGQLVLWDKTFQLRRYTKGAYINYAAPVLWTIFLGVTFQPEIRFAPIGALWFP